VKEKKVMTNQSKLIRIFSSSLALLGFVLLSGSFTDAKAQTRDPFAKPEWAKPKTASTGTSSSTGTTKVSGKGEKPKPAGPPPVVPVNAPPIEQRISFYKRQREDAATSGREIPKVTSVLTLEEMSVIGILRTPRGNAAMVQAKPINLSYTVYPGEKFFDGQLVAIEDNRLVFRKIVKMSNGKFIASVENKTLRQYSTQEEVQGTAPVEPASGKTETANTTAPSSTEKKESKPVAPTIFISPLDEMNKQPVEKKKETAKDKSGKKAKKPVKVAKNKSN
jgi:hypothetical protein